MLHVVSMAPWFYLLHRNETLVLHRCELGAWPGAGEDWISEPVLWTDSWIHLGLLISMTESDLCLGAKAVRIIVMLLDWFIYRYFCCVCVCVCVSHLGGGTKVWCVLRVCWVIHRGSFGRGVSGFLGFPATEKDPEICSTLVIFGSKNRSRRSINEPLRIVQNPPDGDSAFSES